MTFDVSLEEFNKYIKADDWYNVQLVVHNLKGTLRFIIIIKKNKLYFRGKMLIKMWWFINYNQKKNVIQWRN